MRRLEELRHIIRLTYKLFTEDVGKTIIWTMSKNTLFFGNSPISMVIIGKGNIVIAKLEEFLS